MIATIQTVADACYHSKRQLQKSLKTNKQTVVENSLIKHSTQCFLEQILLKALYFMKLHIFIIQTAFNNGIFSMSFASNFVRRNKNTIPLIKYWALLFL